MLECMDHKSVEKYLNTRDDKYLNNVTNINMDNIPYFKEWLSGFIEAEGCFSIRTSSNNHSFSIGQKDDKYILEKIKSYFESTNQVRELKNNFWLIEIYKKSTLIQIMNHCHQYPLLGEKFNSYKKLKNILNLLFILA